MSLSNSAFICGWSFSIQSGVAALLCHRTPKLINPIRDEDVGIALRLAVTIGSKHQLLSISGKHWEAIKRFVECNSFQTASVSVNDIQIKIAAARIIHVGGENYALAVGKKVRRKVRL